MARKNSNKWCVEIRRGWDTSEFLFDTSMEASQFLEMAVKSSVDECIRTESRMKLYIPAESDESENAN